MRWSAICAGNGKRLSGWRDGHYGATSIFSASGVGVIVMMEPFSAKSAHNADTYGNQQLNLADYLYDNMVVDLSRQSAAHSHCRGDEVDLILIDEARRWRLFRSVLRQRSFIK